MPAGLKVVIIGDGPAGLTAAYELAKHRISSTVLEADNVVGGLVRTVNYKGHLFDIGGHRFFATWDEVKYDNQDHSAYAEPSRICQTAFGDKNRERLVLRPRNEVVMVVS